MEEKSKLVIFDFDGVIVDSTNVMIQGMQKLYPGITRDLFVEASKKPIAERNEEIEETIKKHTPTKKEIEEYHNQKISHAPLHRGMKTTIQDLSERFFLGLNTNARRDNCIPILENLKLDTYFDVLETGGDRRTKVEKSENIMSELGVLPRDALFVTDTAGDVLDAEEAGMPSIAVTWGVHDRSYFEEGEASDGVIDIVESADELYDAILKHFK